MNGKRILIISYYFAPQNLIGAVRPTKLAKYLARMGHDVTVVCGVGTGAGEDPTLRRDLQELPNVHVVEEWNPLRRIRAQKSAGAPSAQPAAVPAAHRPSLKRRAADAAYRYLRWTAECSFGRRAVKKLRELGGSYDVVFSSYAPVSVHETARWAKKHGMAGRWIADFRDEVGLPFRWQEGRKRRFLRMLRRDADVLCGVSQGILDMMEFSQGRVLSNGFDREDLPAAAPAQPDGLLRVVYCGQFNMGRKGVGDRDVTPVMQALRALIDEGVLAQERLRLVYAGREGALMRRYAAAYGLEGCVEDHGQVSREDSIALQRNADLLLMASWHTAAQKGILTGKLFEYMMMDKPIVCCIKGELPNSGVRQVLEETGMGLCCEEACGAADEARLLDGLRALLSAPKGQRTETHGAVERYAYPELARRLESWFEEEQE